MFKQSLLYRAMLFSGVLGLSVAGSDAAVHKSKNKGADKSHSLKNAIEAGARSGELVPTLEQFAEREADLLEKSTKSRMEIWFEVWRAYGLTDFPHLEGYPAMVRHAFAKKFGLNMSLSLKDWTADQKKLYESFCSTQTRPFQLFIDLARAGNGEHGANGTQRVIELLNPETSGSLPAKVEAAKVMLGKPRKVKGADQVRNDDGPATSDFKANGNGTQPIGASVDGKKWDVTDLKKKTPVEVCIVLVATMPYNDVMQLVQACGKRLATSNDGLDKLASERIATAVTEYLTKSSN